MPSKKQYNLVHNDEYDTRIPLHSEEAFHRGIVFQAKFIGSMDVPRPTSRLEIVAAMRRIRYEFKAKGVKKKKVTLEVSVDGLKVSLRKKKKKEKWIEENKAFQMHYPIYRIFYVSHDSHDLKIFSYIARDGNSNSFKCNVFKSSKKSQAMRVVRTVGQAFEVCHKLSVNAAADDQDISIDKDRSRERSEEHLLRSEDYDDEMTHERQQTINRPRSSSPNVHKDISLSNDGEDVVEDQQNSAPPCILRTHGSSTSPIRQSPMENVSSECGDMSFFGGNELTALKHEIQLLRERLEQQSQQTCAAVGHARLLQDQLAAESAARVEAQARTHQLLIQNKELLEHIGALVNHLREQERASGAHGTVQPHNTGTGSAMNPQTPSVPNMPSLGQLQQRPTGQGGSSWELEAPSFTYSYTPEARFSNSGMDLHQGFATSTDQLHFQTQLLERLHNISPYQSQRSPYTTPSPYSMPAPSFLLSPSLNKPSNCTQPPSLPGLSVRVSQANSFASSPVMVHKAPLFSSQSDPLDSLTELHTFIKPLPCTLPRQRNTINASRELSISDKLQQQMQRSSCPNPTVMTSTNSSGSTTTNTTIILDPAPQGRRHESRVKLKNESPARENTVTDSIDKSNLVTILRAPGPPPSRTTSARLPARNDIMNQVQRKTWARHTTK